MPRTAVLTLLALAAVPSTAAAGDARVVVQDTAGNGSKLVRVETAVGRACEPAKGLDHVLRIATNSLDTGETLSAVGADRDWAVMVSSFGGDRYNPDDCAMSVVTVRVPDGLRRSRILGQCLPGGPERGVPVVVTQSGTAAWIEQRPEGQRLMTLVDDIESRELAPMSAPPITDLRAEGDTVRWRRDGVERSAAL